MSLVPSAKVVLGNLQYDVQLAEVTASLGLVPAVNVFRVVLPAGVRLEAEPGDDASLELDGGEGAATVLTGKVRRVRRRLLDTRVSAADGSADLASARARATYEKQSAKEVIRGLAGEAGADTGTLDLDLPLAAFVAHQGRTVGEHVASLARLGGAMAAFDGDGRLEVKPLPSEPEVALRHGRELLACEVRESAAPRARRVTVGSGPAGSPAAPDALRPAAGFLPDDAPESGADVVWSPTPLLRTPAAARTAAQAANAFSNAEARRITAQCFLLPALRPGMVVQLQELPNGLSGGPWLITRVEHRLVPRRGGWTAFEGRAALGTSEFDLLGSALSAVGGLL